MRIKFKYCMQLSFSSPVYRHSYSLNCMPKDTARQNISDCKLIISPDSLTNSYTNFFGSKIIYGSIGEDHSFFDVKLTGTVETGLDIYEEYCTDNDIYRVQSQLTKPGRSVHELYKLLKKSAPYAPYERALYFMHCVHDAIEYKSLSTDIKTTAEDSLSRGCGVCQDYAHILISLLRMDGFPARYTVGMMLGEGESHAWAEVNLNGYWYGLDAANNLLTDSCYIKISHGRDYKDCVVSKGVFFGTASQTQKITVHAEEI